MLVMSSVLLPTLLFILVATALGVGLLALGYAVGPRRQSAVKGMPYESGMDPVHDARRRFDVRFHLVAVAFLIFDVELLFLYPWAVANKNPAGLAAAAVASPSVHPNLIFLEVMAFIGLLTLGFAYAWRRGVFRW